MKMHSPLSISQVSITQGFWKSKQQLIVEQVIPYQWRALNDEVPGADPSHAVENFRIASGQKCGTFYGEIFQDSDVGKWIEAAAYSLILQHNPDLESKVDEVVELIAAAQEPDGYVQTYFTVKAHDKRWSDFAMGHEMYCGGHLIEAAVAYYRATGKARFLEVMRRYADLLCRKFGPGPGQIVAYDGHPEVELALHKLADATGDEKYRILACFFVDERGKHPEVIDNSKILAWPAVTHRWNGSDYYVDHAPVRDQRTVEGHAVRALYLYSAMADQTRLRSDPLLDKALDALWHNMVEHRMYVTGGVGSQAVNERFTVDDDLPTDRAYTESCASIGVVLWAWRMTLRMPNAKYADVLERALYNGSLSGISLDGTRYFYVNPLEVVPRVARFRADLQHVKTQRVEWFGCACCPPNIARTVASFGQYLYTQSDDGIWAHQFASSVAEISFRNGSLRVAQHTEYPWDGRIEFTLDSVPNGAGAWAFSIRIPEWCTEYTLDINGTPATGFLRNGYLTIRREWEPGDQMILLLPMKVRFLQTHTRVRATIGKVAVQRGPLVYCAEEIDNGPDLHSFRIDTASEVCVEPLPELGPGCRRIIVGGSRSVTEENVTSLSVQSPASHPSQVILVPYHLWGNRGEGEMAVWLRSL